jgi:hypothetical protein
MSIHAKYTKKVEKLLEKYGNEKWGQVCSVDNIDTSLKTM